MHQALDLSSIFALLMDSTVHVPRPPPPNMNVSYHADQGLALLEEDIKTLFQHFDLDGSGEIDFSEFRRFLLGGVEQTGHEVQLRTSRQAKPSTSSVYQNNSPQHAQSHSIHTACQ